MAPPHSKSRQAAEIAFGNVQTQFYAKNQALDELENAEQSREAKTLRLRAARLEKEMADRASATAAMLAKRGKTLRP